MTRRSLLKRGSVAIMTGLLAIPLIAMTGLAIDLARIWLVRSRLQMSLDAAVLVVARDIATGGISTDGLSLFWANFDRISTYHLVGYWCDRDDTGRHTRHRRRGGQCATDQPAPTSVPTLLSVMGIGPVTVSAASTAQTAATGWSLRLVLDNTGSMAWLLDLDTR